MRQENPPTTKPNQTPSLPPLLVPSRQKGCFHSCKTLIGKRFRLEGSI